MEKSLGLDEDGETEMVCMVRRLAVAEAWLLWEAVVDTLRVVLVVVVTVSREAAVDGREDETTLSTEDDRV